jgi:hypothetical protein
VTDPAVEPHPDAAAEKSSRPIATIFDNLDLSMLIQAFAGALFTIIFATTILVKSSLFTLVNLVKFYDN